MGIMFSILQKPQDNVNAEDLETLQNEIERRLVGIVTERWKLERDLETSNHLSPDSVSQPSPISASTDNNFGTKTTKASSQPTSNLPGGKLRNSMKSSQIDAQLDNASDGFKGSLFSATNGNNNGVIGSNGGTNGNDTDSLSSENSLNSNLTGSTIITANLADYATHNQQSSLVNNNSTSIKRGLKNSANDRPSKRFRQNSSNNPQASQPRRPPNSKHRSKIVPQSKYRNSTEESRPNKQHIVKNEAPDKLWPFVEQFCAAPTEEQVKALEEMIKSMDNDEEYYKIPDSLKKDSPVTESPIKDPSSNNVGGASTKNNKKSKPKTEEGSSLGALTQRLVSSLIVEADDNVTDASKSSSDTSPPAVKKRKTKPNKGIDLNNAKNLEKNIRQQLEEHSILSQQDDIPFTSEEDENLRELLVYQHELLSIQTQNKLSMHILLRKAKKHIELEKERGKLKGANADVIAAYQRLIQAKQRKRNPSKKEKEAAWKALKVHDVIFKKCDELYLTNLDRNSG